MTFIENAVTTEVGSLFQYLITPVETADPLPPMELATRCTVECFYEGVGRNNTY